MSLAIAPLSGLDLGRENQDAMRQTVLAEFGRAAKRMRAGEIPLRRPTTPHPIVVVNVVLTAVMAPISNDSQKNDSTSILDIQTILRTVPGASADMQCANSATIRLHNPSATVTLYSNGECVVTGCADREPGKLALHIVQGMIQSATYVDVRVFDIRTENMVFTGVCDFDALDLDYLQAQTGATSIYRDNFPGLRHKLEQNPETGRKIVATTFQTGSLIIAGCLSHAEALRNYLVLYQKLYLARVDPKTGRAYGSRGVAPIMLGHNAADATDNLLMLEELAGGTTTEKVRSLPAPIVEEPDDDGQVVELDEDW